MAVVQRRARGGRRRGGDAGYACACAELRRHVPLKPRLCHGGADHRRDVLVADDADHELDARTDGAAVFDFSIFIFIEISTHYFLLS